jgi:hypothetical protein
MVVRRLAGHATTDATGRCDAARQMNPIVMILAIDSKISDEFTFALGRQAATQVAFHYDELATA